MLSFIIERLLNGKKLINDFQIFLVLFLIKPYLMRFVKINNLWSM